MKVIIVFYLHLPFYANAWNTIKSRLSYLRLPDVAKNGQIVGCGRGLGGRESGGGGEDETVPHEALALVMAAGAERLLQQEGVGPRALLLQTVESLQRRHSKHRPVRL
jgi:hypothetical protein